MIYPTNTHYIRYIGLIIKWAPFEGAPTIFLMKKRRHPKQKGALDPSSASAGPTSVMSSPYFSHRGRVSSRCSCILDEKLQVIFIDTNLKAPGNS